MEADPFHFSLKVRSLVLEVSIFLLKIERNLSSLVEFTFLIIVTAIHLCWDSREIVGMYD